MLAVLVIAPLATMLTYGQPDDMPMYGYPFTYSEEDEDYPTLFIGPDRVPLATWEDGDGRLHLSRLSIT
ncbi:MAG: hypothetical protein GWN74_20355, partial [Thermoplasmata archaeon]|nr:hypothetical protein [Thermoplasmata archaeon]